MITIVYSAGKWTLFTQITRDKVMLMMMIKVILRVLKSHKIIKKMEVITDKLI
jgi:hypothetical protein